MVLKKKKKAKQTSPPLFSDSRPCFPGNLSWCELLYNACVLSWHQQLYQGAQATQNQFFVVFFFLSLPVANNNDVRLFSQAPEHLPGWKPVSLFHKSDGRCEEAKILHVCFECAMLLLSHIFMVGNKECTFPWTGDETFVAFLFQNWAPHQPWSVDKTVSLSTMSQQSTMRTHANLL